MNNEEYDEEKTSLLKHKTNNKNHIITNKNHKKSKIRKYFTKKFYITLLLLLVLIILVYYIIYFSLYNYFMYFAIPIDFNEICQVEHVNNILNYVNNSYNTDYIELDIDLDQLLLYKDNNIDKFFYSCT